ncbi:hypothetical protein D0867_04021 [Hortaea werneckii]|uniref:Uncharacterized protein n=1 Tax=Hortaea werneckii TaxID=91943 RepID=A0A3M6ZYM5_HORWE|nr:hypothetical protein D0867_04021 [Hortaea werneckii]
MGQKDIQAFFHDLLKLGMDFKTRAQVCERREPDLSNVTFGPLPVKGLTILELKDEFQALSQASSNWSSPTFMGFPDAGNGIAAIGAALLIPFLNQNLANQTICSPRATFVEMEVVHWLRQQIGFSVPDEYCRASEVGGILTLEGCLSNTIALMAAREFIFPGSAMNGIGAPPHRICVLVPDVIEHYSIRSAMSWLGMGENHVVRVPVDGEFRVRLADLEGAIDRGRRAGRCILAFVAYAGDSRSMQIDHLDGIATLLRRKKVWFHVDACHGSQLAFSRNHRHKLAGIENADSVTIDPHKVLWIPNTCSFVLFKDPQRLANISTNSDLILKTQWSLGQVTPCIGSKAFDALKLWATIKYFGQDAIGNLIDERLELTTRIQMSVEERPDLVLLNKTNINSCMLIFVPEKTQSVARQHKIKLSVADCEKVRDINHSIYKHILKDGKWYLHGFNLKSCPCDLLDHDTSMYVLRTMNGNPLTTIDHVAGLLDEVVRKGNELVVQRGYRTLDSPLVEVSELATAQKLEALVNSLMQGYEYVALVYGSGAGSKQVMLSDIDLMVFVEDSFELTTDRKNAFEQAFRRIMKEESVQIDAEVSFDRKLLIPLSFAEHAATGAYLHEVDNDVVQIVKSQEYLSSDELIGRLVFNVLTVPHEHLCGSSILLDAARRTAGATLVRLIDRVSDSRRPLACDNFVRRALANEAGKFGEAYLGYKNRPEVIANLKSIWHEVRNDFDSQDYAMEPAQPPACVVLLNGFPGTGKYAVARTLRSKLGDTNTRLVDNHLIIDPAEAAHPGRGYEHKALRDVIRRAVFQDLKRLPENITTIVLTGCFGQNSEDVAVYAEHVEIAQARGVRFLSFTLTVEKSEHLLRLQSPDRVYGQKTKLNDPDVLETIMTNNEILDPTIVVDEGSDVDFRSIRHHLIDTTGLTVSESADRVLDIIAPQQQQQQRCASPA